MDPQSQAWLEQLIASAASVPPADRDAFIRQACGERTDLAEAAFARLAAQIPTKTMPAQASATTMIGPYRVLRELGKGGMGVVYLAVRDDGAFRKNVAIKLLRGDAVTREFVERFRNERQVLANFDHPNIARILDGGDTVDGMPFYVMEYVEGRPLDRYCDEEKLSLNDRLRLYQKLISAVHYLHQNQVVHRDLKPSNVLVANDGTVKLLDFGIAKQLGPASMELTTAEGTPLTPAYASPEQFTGRADSKSDIYTLGVILYLLLTGRLPDQATVKPPSEMIREDFQRTQETTKQLKRRLIGDLDMVVLKAMSRESRARYASAQEFAEDIERYLQGKPVMARPRSGPSPLVLAAGLTVLLLGGGAAWYFSRGANPGGGSGEQNAAAGASSAGASPAIANSAAPYTPPPSALPSETNGASAGSPVGTGSAQTPAAPVSSGGRATAAAPPAAVPQSNASRAAGESVTASAQATPAPAVPSTFTPAVSAPAAPASSPALDEARERYATLAGKVAAAEQLFTQVKTDLESKGLNVRADMISRITSMKLNLSQAKENIDRGNAEGAQKNLTAADALASRVNKELGR